MSDMFLGTLLLVSVIAWNWHQESGMYLHGTLQSPGGAMGEKN